MTDIQTQGDAVLTGPNDDAEILRRLRAWSPESGDPCPLCRDVVAPGAQRCPWHRELDARITALWNMIDTYQQEVRRLRAQLAPDEGMRWFDH